MGALVSIALGVLLAWFPTRLIIWFSALIGIGVISINTRLSLLNGFAQRLTSMHHVIQWIRVSEHVYDQMLLPRIQLKSWFR